VSALILSVLNLSLTLYFKFSRRRNILYFELQQYFLHISYKLLEYIRDLYNTFHTPSYNEYL